MLTSKECSAKADELEALGLPCPASKMRDLYLISAASWRGIARLARDEEERAETHPAKHLH
jgi:hypothetical protein